MNVLHPVNLLKRAITQDGWRRPVQPVSVGDRFERQDEAVSVWIVERISQVRMSEYPLVSLSRAGHPDISKTVSLSTLCEKSEFRIAV
jgi:hypothetical protein